MSTSVDVYALPKLPSTATRGPTRICACMFALLLVLVLVAIAPSIVVSFGGDGVVMHAVVAGQAAAAAGAERDDPEVLSGISTGWRDALDSADHAQARLIADVAHTLGWLVEQARAPR